MREGTIFDLKRMSVDDGPGLRTVVFFKGCPLRCVWCHSPESIDPNPELVIYESKCIGCGRCIEVCPNGVFSISETGKRLIQRDKCTACGECARYCYAGSLEIKGKRITADDLLHQIEKDRVFYDVSGGGVTFSGGEPLLQHRFLRDILKKCKAADIHTVIDTCGYASPQRVISIIPFTDLFLFDLKHMDEEKHKELTGVSNSIIITNLKIIAESGRNVIVSFPVVPGHNSSDENLKRTMRLVKNLKIGKMRLLSYNKLAGSKYRWLGRSYSLEEIDPAGDDWIVKAKELGKEYGIEVKAK